MDKILQKTKTERTIRNVYILAFVLLLLSYFITLYSNKQLVKQADRVQHTNNVIKNLDNVLANVKDAETGIRGYVLTENIKFLFPYYGTKERIDSLHKILSGQFIDNPVQEERLKRLMVFINERFELFAFSLQSFEGNHLQRTDSMRSRQPDAIRMMENIGSTVSLMQRTEERLLSTRNNRMQQTFRSIDAVTFISLLLAFSLIIFGFFTYMRISKSRKKAQEEIEDYQLKLNNRIEELNQANKELIKMRSQEKFAATGRIARTIAHEIRNPLTNINLAAEQLRTEPDPTEENTGFLYEMINRNSHRINQLISDLLNSTKFSDLNYEKKSVNDFVEETLKEAEDRVALNHIQVIKKYSTGPCDISIDISRMKIALLNIIINAIEAMEGREGSQLTLETIREDKRCKIIISDNGNGLDKEALSHIFEPYFTSKPNGNGLGLTNTQSIILNHRGEISVESTVFKGTSFIIILDLAN